MACTGLVSLGTEGAGVGSMDLRVLVGLTMLGEKLDEMQWPVLSVCVCVCVCVWGGGGGDGRMSGCLVLAP